jgi:hypothetical protein
MSGRDDRRRAYDDQARLDRDADRSALALPPGQGARTGSIERAGGELSGSSMTAGPPSSTGTTATQLPVVGDAIAELRTIADQFPPDYRNAVDALQPEAAAGRPTAGVMRCQPPWSDNLDRLRFVAPKLLARIETGSTAAAALGMRLQYLQEPFHAFKLSFGERHADRS